MNFRTRHQETPEINLIPFIDVLLVILIFLMLSTTYSKFTEMQLTLPVADTDTQRNYPQELTITISADGKFGINRSSLTGQSMQELVTALSEATTKNKNAVVIISADANAKHQSIISAMESARRAGLNHISFATQSTAQAEGK